MAEKFMKLPEISYFVYLKINYFHIFTLFTVKTLDLIGNTAPMAIRKSYARVSHSMVLNR